MTPFKKQYKTIKVKIRLNENILEVVKSVKHLKSVITEDGNVIKGTGKKNTTSRQLLAERKRTKGVYKSFIFNLL